MIRRLGYFLGGAIATWVLLAIPARHLWGNTAAVYATTALLLCVLPTTVTLLGSGWAFGRSPEQQLVVVFGGTALRMFVVLLGGLALYYLVPPLPGEETRYFQSLTSPGFWTWVLVFYLVTLVLEKVVVLTRQPGEPAPVDGQLTGPGQANNHG